jgi:hypothetical protein
MPITCHLDHVPDEISYQYVRVHGNVHAEVSDEN